MKDQAGNSSRALAVALALALAAMASSCGRGGSSRSGEYPVAGVVVQSPARFDLWLQGRDCWIPGAAGATVMYGDRLKNGAPGGLVMALAAGGSLRAAESAEFEVTRDAEKAPCVDVKRGELWLDGAGGATARSSSVRVVPVEPKEEGERSAFSLEVKPGGPSTVAVADGQVRVEAAGETLTLLEGTSATCEQGQPPSRAVKSAGEAPQGGFAGALDLLRAPYFRNEATRSQAEDDANTRLSVDHNDAWAHVNLGRALLDAGRTEEAGQNFARALEIKQGFPQATAGLGRVALRDARWNEAARLYEQARLADRSSLEARLGSAEAALGMGKLQEAKRWYKATLDLDSQSQQALAGLGMVNILSGDLAGASADLADAIKVQPSHKAALVFRSYLRSLKGKVPSALAILKKAVEVDAKDGGLRCCMADLCLRAGRNDLAKSAYKQMCGSDDPEIMAAGYQGAGSVEMFEGNARDAQSAWAKAQDLHPDRTPVLQNLGQAALLLEENEAAAAALSRAVTVDIEDWRAHEMLARALLETGSNSDAVTEGRAAATLAPDEWTAHIVLGLALEACGANEEAALELSRGIALKPAGGLSAAGHALFALALAKQGKTADALAEYRRAQQVNPDDGSYYRLAGDMLERLGRKSDALEQFRKAAQMNRSDVLSQVRLAEALNASGKKAEAIEVLRGSVERDPNEALSRQLLGEYLLADGDAEGAVFQLDAAARVDGVRPELLASVLVTRGNARDRGEDFQGAIEDYSRAISSDPGRGDAWFYMAGDLERTGRPSDAKAAYANAAALCKDRSEWKKFYDESLSKLSQLG